MSKSHVSRVRELYKLILRVHRSLPDDLKILGDNYAREEFKRHKKCKPQEAQIFLNEWREYAVNMSRQAAPVRAARRPPEDEQQAGPSRRVRAVDQEQAAGGGEVRAADPRQVAGGGVVRAAYSAQAARRDVEAAVAGAHPRFGNDLDEERIEHFTPEQIYNLYRLLMTTRGVDPQAEYVNEPIDIGIELIEADVFSKLTQDAKKSILEMESEEIRQFVHGEIQEQDIIFNHKFWFEVFSDAQTVKDINEFRVAVKAARIAKDEAKKARSAADIAEKKSVKSMKLADQAKVESEIAKKTAAGTEDKELHNTVIKLEKKALKKVNEAKTMHEEAVKLEMVAKSKEVEAKAALDFRKELRKNVNEDLEKYKI